MNIDLYSTCRLNSNLNKRVKEYSPKNLESRVNLIVFLE